MGIPTPKSIRDRLHWIFNQNVSPHRFALATALGILMGIFPVLGLSTLLCFISAVLLRLNLAWIQVFNYAVYPLQLVLAPLFLFAGSWLMGEPLSIDSAKALLGLISNDLRSGLQSLGSLVLYAVGVWLLISPLLALAVYGLARFIRERFDNRSPRSTVWS